MWPEVWTRVSKKQEENYIAECVWKKVFKLQAARRDKYFYEVLTDVKDSFKGSADTHVKLEKDTALALRCIEKDGSRGQPQTVATSVDTNEEQSTS